MSLPNGESAPIRVLVVDDHLSIRQAIGFVLQTTPDLELAGEASDGVEALEQCAAVRPDVILLDLVMPRMNGVEAAEALTRRFPQVKIVLLTSTESDDPLTQAALAAGAAAYLRKQVGMADLLNTIRRVAAGTD